MKSSDRVNMDQWFMVAVGAALMALSTAGVFYGVRASIAAQLSARAQLSQPPAEVDQILAWCKKAYALYPWNYYFSIVAAEAAYYQSGAVYGEARARRLRLAQVWCDRGLSQNPHKSQLRRLKTRFLWEDSPRQAIEYWKAYTAWQYWEPYNHATLAELYARSGDIEKAEQELKLGQGDATYETVAKLVREEKRNWEELGKGKPLNWGE